MPQTLDHRRSLGHIHFPANNRKSKLSSHDEQIFRLQFGERKEEVAKATNKMAIFAGTEQ